MFIHTLIVLVTFATRALAIGSCHTPGPAFLTPKLTALDLQGSVLPLLNNLIDDLLKGKERPDGWSPKNTSFAIQLTSNQETLWESYHTASILGNYTDSDPTPVSADTVFRIASISKTFTVYALLLESGIGLDDPITKYLPGLTDVNKETLKFIKWDQITIRSLASQLSGIGRGTGIYDLAVSRDILPDPLAVGLPPIAFNDTFLAPCLKNSTDRACTPSEIIGIANRRLPVFYPNDRSTYSNIAYTLLGLAHQNATGKAYTDIINSYILEPLGMNHTGTTKPRDSEGIIPSGPNDWAQELGPDNASGGIYSSANDLSKYLRSILNSTLLPQAVTNAWMKPHSWTSSGSNSAYGMPWEILRTNKLVNDGRPIDIITKGGSLGGYYSTIALIPEFGLGLTILIAGDQSALLEIRERLISLVVPAIEDVVRSMAKKTYTGWFGLIDDWWGPLNPDWSIVVEVDDGPGLRLSSFTLNKTDFIPVYGQLKGMPKDESQWEARLLPTNVVYGGTDQAWRLTAIPKRNEDETKIFDDWCMTDVDSLLFGGWPMEEFIFKVHPDRGAEAVLMRGFRLALFKADADITDKLRTQRLGRRQEIKSSWVL